MAYKTVPFVNTITRVSRGTFYPDEHLHETWDAAMDFLLDRERRNIEAARQEVKRAEARYRALVRKKARGEQ